MSDIVDLFGTNQPPVSRIDHSFGPWSFTLEGGALRHIKLHGVEGIRGIAFLVRDRDWGTLSATITNEQISHDPTSLTLSYEAAYATGDAQLNVQVSINVTAQNLSMTALGQTRGAFETNRAGFTVLHPISSVAGHPVQVTHSDGTHTNATFPYLIDPWQPFMDITALTHEVADAALTCQFHGDTFEMEDQRQWGDASYKTYNRPLAKPWPYLLDDGETLRQSVNLAWQPHTPTASRIAVSDPESVTFPQMALVLTSDDAARLAVNPSDIRQVNPQRILCHLDATLGDTRAQFAAFAAAQISCPDQAFDLELICKCDADPTPELLALAAQMRGSGFAPDSILVCPAVDRQSTPPGSDWPACPPLTDIHAAAKTAFAGVSLGGGMVSFFPELNRKRPPVDMLAFVSHGLCPIVHAADDVSVMETLEAIPHITRSARNIIGKKDYRIGPATIAMRQNPYGTRTIPNPSQTRLCMTDDDPRHRAQFGAAYALGLATALASAGVSVWCPAALYGERGILSDGAQWPIQSALKVLATLAGKPVHSADIIDGIARLCVGGKTISVNLTPEQNGALGPYDWTLDIAT